MTELTIGGWIFMIGAWVGILGWVVYCFWKVFKHQDH
jgi:hypothetical protein